MKQQSSPPLCQDLTDTRASRYPLTFLEAARLTKNLPVRILSYGCSVGHEVVALKEIFPPGSKVVGYDQNESALLEASKRDPGGEYTLDFPTGPFDIVFCMSVLCVHPLNADRKALKLKDFEANVRAISNILAPGGLFVLFNSQYPLLQTEIGRSRFLPAAGSRVCEKAFVTLINPADGSVLRQPTVDNGAAPFQGLPDALSECPVFYRRLLPNDKMNQLS